MSGRGWRRIFVVSLAVALLAVLPDGAHADFHMQGYGIGNSGVVTVTPGLSDTPGSHVTRLDFTATGAAFNMVDVSTNFVWDCRHDEGDDESGVRHGFELKSLVDETAERGAGTAIGRCTGKAPEYSEPYEITCPVNAMAFVRHGTVLQLTGDCMYVWGPGLGGGDFVLNVQLANPSADGTRFEVVGAVFKFRG